MNSISLFSDVTLVIPNAVFLLCLSTFSLMIFCVVLLFSSVPLFRILFTNSYYSVALVAIFLGLFCMFHQENKNVGVNKSSPHCGTFSYNAVRAKIKHRQRSANEYFKDTICERTCALCFAFDFLIFALFYRSRIRMCICYSKLY